MTKNDIKRSPDCCGCPSFPFALCPPCQRYNLRNNYPDWPFDTDPATIEQPIPHDDIEIALLVQKDKYKCTCYVPKHAKVHPHWCKSKQNVISKIDIVLKKIEELQKIEEEKI